MRTISPVALKIFSEVFSEGFKFENYRVMPGLNDHPDFIRAMAEEALACLKHIIPDKSIHWDAPENQRKALIAE